MMRKNRAQRKVSPLFPVLIASCLLASGLLFSSPIEEQKKGAFESAFQLGESERQQGKYEKAIEYFKEALAISTERKDPNAEVLCLMKLGLLHWNLGHMADSEKLYSQALAKIKAPSQRNLRETCLTALAIKRLIISGKACLASKNVQQSIKSFQQAIDLSRKIENGEFTIKCLRQMSFVYFDMCDFNKYRTYNEEALKMARKIKHRLEEGRCLNNIGVQQWQTANFSGALRFCQGALLILRELNARREESDCLANLGLIYAQLGDYKKALSYFMDSLRISQEREDRENISWDLLNMGFALARIASRSKQASDYYKALEYYDRCLESTKNNVNDEIECYALNNKAFLFSRLEKYDVAIFNLNRAYLKVKRNKNLNLMDNILTNLGTAYRKKGLVDKAIEYFVKAIRLAREIKNEEVLWEAAFGLGQCYEKKGENALALFYYKTSMAVIETIRSRISLDIFKAGFSRDKLDVFEQALNLLFKSRPAGSAADGVEGMFSIVERAKARGFLESLNEAALDIQEGLSPLGKKREGELSEKISSLIYELSRRALDSGKKKEDILRLERAEDEYMNLVADVKTDHPESMALATAKMCPLRRLQEEFLDDRTGIAEYFLGETRSFLFFITKQKAEIFELPARSGLESSLKGYLRMLRASDLEKFQGAPAAERITKELLFPLTGSSAQGLKRLIVIPDGILYYLPFETLRIPSEDGSTPVFLLKKYEVSYAPSSSSLVFLSAKAVGGKRKMLLAFGHPDYDAEAGLENRKEQTESESLGKFYLSRGFDFSPLPFSKKEVLTIAAHYPERERDIYLDHWANEEIVKSLPLKDYHIVHFACHGLLDEESPLRSALAMSVDKSLKEDGFLQVREIYNLRMNSDLVVLSACQTGRGSLEKGEGVLGLPRIFFYAGSKSVVSTLWPIKDKSTAIFMDKFYGYLAKGCGKAQSLRLAKIEMMHSKFSHPFYWGAFVLNGDFRPISIEPPGSGSGNIGWSVGQNERSNH